MCKLADIIQYAYAGRFSSQGGEEGLLASPWESTPMHTPSLGERFSV